MDWQTLLAGAIGVITTLITQYSIKLKTKADARKTNFEADNVLLESYNKLISKLESIKKDVEGENEKLRVEVRSYEDKRHEQNQKITNLQFKIIQLESAQMDLPIPMWLKDREGGILFLNKAYESLFLIPNGKDANDYIGSDDIKIWGKEIGALYKSHDLEVVQTGQIWNGKEKILIKGKIEIWQIIKYPRYFGNSIIGIAGVAIPPPPKINE